MIKGRTLLHSLFRAQLAKAYQTVGVLFEVLCAVNKTEKVKEVSSEAQDFEDPDVHHRHVSHLFGLFLGHTTTLEDTPDLCKAVDNSLYKRGDFGPGWLTTWKMALWAHLHNSEHAYKLVKLLINLVDPDHEANYEGGLYGNLFTAHPPFQIDANFGFTAGIAECYFRAQ